MCIRDSDYGQTLFLDGILVDSMVANGEIGCKLSASVMVYIHWRTPTFHLSRVFNPTPPYGKSPVEQTFSLDGASLKNLHPDFQACFEHCLHVPAFR